MRRRRFLSLATLLVPGAAGCAGSFDSAPDPEFVVVRRAGVVVEPLLVASQLSTDANIYSRGGENEWYSKKIREAIGDRLEGYVPELRKGILRSLTRVGISNADVAYRADAGRANPSYGPGEPFYLRCVPGIIFVRDRSIVVPVATSRTYLLSPSGITLWWKFVSYGGTEIETYFSYGTTSDRLKKFEEMIAEPSSIATVFMTYTEPLAKAIAEAVDADFRRA